MDTSETYIRMCEGAEEIQKQAEWDDSDYTAYKTTKKYVGRVFEYQYNRPNLIWLPRQDQLQEMVDWKTLHIAIRWTSAPFRFYWQDDPLHTQGVNGDSMEQLWLAFVMREKYGKWWDGQGWVKE